jgi:hypothetical protein
MIMIESSTAGLCEGFFSRLLEGLGVRLPISELNTISTATELIEHRRYRARVHVVVPMEPTKWIEHAIGFVDTTILDLGGIPVIARSRHPLGLAIFLSIFGVVAADLCSIIIPIASRCL